MDVLAASEKNLAALRAASQLGGISLKDGDTNSLFNHKFSQRKFIQRDPFELQIKYEVGGTDIVPYGYKLFIYNQYTEIKNEVDSRIFDSNYRRLIALNMFPDITSGSYALWDIVEVVESKPYFMRDYHPYFIYIKHADLSGYIPDGKELSYACNCFGIDFRTIGTIRQSLLSTSISSESNSKYGWSIEKQYVKSELTYYYTNSQNYFSIVANINDSWYSDPTNFIIYPEKDNQFRLEQFQFRINDGYIEYMGNPIMVPSTKIDADEVYENYDNHMANVFVSLDPINLSANIEFASGRISMFQNGKYNQYLGSVITNYVDGIPVINCQSFWTGPIYIPYLIPSGQTFIYGDNYQLRAIPLSAGFIEAVSGAAVPSGITYDIKFVESTECDENE